MSVGELVALDRAIGKVLAKHDYQESVKALLGEIWLPPSVVHYHQVSERPA